MVVWQSIYDFFGSVHLQINHVQNFGLLLGYFWATFGLLLVARGASRIPWEVGAGQITAASLDVFSVPATKRLLVLQLCPPGSVQDAAGAAQCLPCDKGFFQDAQQQTACLPCPQGAFASEVRAQSLSQCNKVTKLGFSQNTGHKFQFSERNPLPQDTWIFGVQGLQRSVRALMSV